MYKPARGQKTCANCNKNLKCKKHTYNKNESVMKEWQIREAEAGRKGANLKNSRLRKATNTRNNSHF